MKIMASGTINANIKYSQIKNNLTTTAAGGVLDARQGKILSDTIASHGPTTQWQASGNINCANNTITALQSVTLTAGTWIIFGFANWAADNTGYRQIQWNTNSSKDPSRYLATCGPAAQGKQTYQQYICYERPTKTTTYTLYGLQNSGSTLVCYPTLGALKVW